MRAEVRRRAMRMWAGKGLGAQGGWGGGGG